MTRSHIHLVMSWEPSFIQKLHLHPKYGIGCDYILSFINTVQQICLLGYIVLKRRNSMGYQACISSLHTSFLLPFVNQLIITKFMAFIAITTAVSINRMIPWWQISHAHTFYIYICIYIFKKRMFLSKLQLYNSKTVILGHRKPAKSGQKNIRCSFQGGLEIIFHLSPFPTSSCCSQKNLHVLHNPEPAVLLWFSSCKKQRNMYIRMYMFVWIGVYIQIYRARLADDFQRQPNLCYSSWAVGFQNPVDSSWLLLTVGFAAVEFPR